MLQIMTGQGNRKRYPTIGARVPEEFKKKFDELLRFMQRDQAFIDRATLVRLLLGADNRVEVKPEWRGFLSGERDSLPESEESLQIVQTKRESKKAIGKPSGS